MKLHLVIYSEVIEMTKILSPWVNFRKFKLIHANKEKDQQEELVLLLIRQLENYQMLIKIKLNIMLNQSTFLKMNTKKLKN